MNLLDAAKVKFEPQAGFFNQITRRYVLKRYLDGATAHELATEYGVNVELIEETIQQAKTEEEGKEVKPMETKVVETKQTPDVTEELPRQRRVITEEDKQFIIEKRMSGMSVVEISKQYGYAQSTIYRTLQESAKGTKRPSRSSSNAIAFPKADELVERYLKGEDVVSLASEYGISEYKAYSVLREADIPAEKRAERRKRIQITKDVVEKFLNHYSIPRIADDLEVSEELVADILNTEDRKRKALQGKLVVLKEEELAKEITIAVQPAEPAEEVMKHIQTTEQKEIEELKSVVASLQAGIQVKQAKINELMSQLEVIQSTQVGHQMAEENQAMRALLKVVL